MRDEPGHSECVRGKAEVVRARQSENRAGERRQPIPQRLLGARPAQSQAGGEPGGSVAEPFRALPGATRLQPLEQRPPQPSVDELPHIAGLLERVGQRVIGFPTAHSLGRILNACGHTDEDELAQRQGRGESHVQGDPRAERVAEKGAWLFADLSPYSLGHEVRRGRQIAPYRCGIAVARQIDRDKGVRHSQQFAEAAPEAPRLRESVQQDQRRSRSAHLYMEWHDR